MGQQFGRWHEQKKEGFMRSRWYARKYSWSEIGRLREEHWYKRESVSVTGLLKLRVASLKWFGYDERMGDERQMRRIMNAEVEGSRPVGRPRTRWKDVIRKDLESSGLSVEQAASVARDRDRWKNTMQASVRSSQVKSRWKGNWNTICGEFERSGTWERCNEIRMRPTFVVNFQ